MRHFRQNFTLAFIGLCAMIATLVSCTDNKVEKAKYTVIFYGCAGGSLDDRFDGELPTLMDAVSDSVRFYCMFKYSANHLDSISPRGKAGQAYRFEVTPALDTLNFEKHVVDSDSSRGMRLMDADVLRNHINMAVRTCPAERYVLVLFGHGSGWCAGNETDNLSAMMKDDSYDWEGITMESIREAIASSDIKRVDNIFLFACNRGRIDNYAKLAPVCDYITGCAHPLMAPFGMLSTMVSSLGQTDDIEKDIALGFCKTEKSVKDFYSLYQENGDIACIRSSRVAEIASFIDSAEIRMREIGVDSTLREQILANTYRCDREWPLYDVADYLRQCALHTGDDNIRALSEDTDSLFADAFVEKMRMVSHSAPNEFTLGTLIE